ncbi:WD40-repeat-containing domain protein [Pyronema domesticum]|nr:WD40-repeat-containing domain protein [Pyronema domesticum]
MEEDDDEDADSVTIRSTKSPAANSTTSMNAKKRDIEETVVNGVKSTKRRKKLSNGLGEDTTMQDAVLSPPLTEDMAVTNGCDVGIQSEEIAEIMVADALVLQEGEGIMACAWNPAVKALLAGGGAIAKIWSVPENATSAEGLETVSLPHEPSRDDADKAKITVIRWSPEGDRLATASYDGQTRIWNATGGLLFTLLMHDTPIASLKWNKTGRMLLTLSCDGKINVWNAMTGHIVRRFDLEEELSDIEWTYEREFVASAENGKVYLFNLDYNNPQQRPLSHQLHEAGSIECLAWDEATKSIATGGNDSTIQIWHRPTIHDTPRTGRLIGHGGTVVAIAWQPNASYNPDAPRRLLASASHDTTIRIWEVNNRYCLRVLKKHLDPIERISFSPDGTKLATGANGAVLIWNAETGTATHVYDRIKTRKKTEEGVMEDVGEINEISWDQTGTRLAVGEGSTKCAIVCINTKPRQEEVITEV